MSFFGSFLDALPIIGAAKNYTQAAFYFLDGDMQRAGEKLGRAADSTPLLGTVKNITQGVIAAAEGDDERAEQKLNRSMTCIPVVGGTVAGSVNSVIAIAEGDLDKLDRATDSIFLVGPLKNSAQGLVALADDDEEKAKQRFGKVAASVPVVRTVKSTVEFLEAVEDGDEELAGQKLGQSVVGFAGDVALGCSIYKRCTRSSTNANRSSTKTKSSNNGRSTKANIPKSKGGLTKAKQTYNGRSTKARTTYNGRSTKVYASRSNGSSTTTNIAKGTPELGVQRPLIDAPLIDPDLTRFDGPVQSYTLTDGPTCVCAPGPIPGPSYFDESTSTSTCFELDESTSTSTCFELDESPSSSMDFDDATSSSTTCLDAATSSSAAFHSVPNAIEVAPSDLLGLAGLMGFTSGANERRNKYTTSNAKPEKKTSVRASTSVAFRGRERFTNEDRDGEHSRENSPNRSQRGEHVINNSVLNLYRNIFKDGNVLEKVQERRGTAAHKALEHPLDDENARLIQYHFIAHIPHESTYRNHNAAEYGNAVKPLVEMLATVMSCCSVSVQSAKSWYKHYHKRIKAVVGEIIRKEVFVDHEAEKYYLDNFSDPVAREREKNRLEEAKRAVRKMLRSLTFSEILTQWVEEIN